MAVVELILDVKSPSFLVGNTGVPKAGEPVYLSDGRYAYGDGVTQFQNLSFFGGASTSYTAGTGLQLSGNQFSINSSVVTLTGSQALSNKTGLISQWTNDAGYLTSAFVLPALTNGSVLFSNGTTIAQDNAKFFWDDTNDIFYVGSNTGAFTNSKAHFENNVNSYSQINSINKSTGISASADVIVTANNGTDTSNFGDFGINNSGFADGSFTIVGALGTYLYSNGGNMAVGTGTANDLVLFTGGTLAVNERIRINSSATKISGLVNIYDTTQTINAGFVTQINGAVLDIGVNNGSANLFGGAYTQSYQGGTFEIDGRPGSMGGGTLYNWYARAETVASAFGTKVMSLSATGILQLSNTLTSAIDVRTIATAQSLYTGYYNTSTQAFRLYGDTSNGGILSLYATNGSTEAIRLVGASAGLVTYLNGSKVGIGQTVATARLDVLDTAEQLRLRFDASNYLSTTVSSTGGVTVLPTGTATSYTVNKLTITAPATSATLTLVTGSSLITAGAFALTLTSTATSNATVPAGTGTLAYLAGTNTWSGATTFSNTVVVSGASLTTKHLIGNSTAPGIAAGVGAGTTPTVTLSGTDLSGFVSVTTGTLPTASGVVVTITFNVAYGVAPKCVQITPANATTAALTGTSMVFVDQAGLATTTFAITAGTVGLVAATAYKWYYTVIQ